MKKVGDKINKVEGMGKKSSNFFVRTDREDMLWSCLCSIIFII